MKNLLLVMIFSTLSLSSIYSFAQQMTENNSKSLQQSINNVSGYVNLNTATIAQLSTLKGVSTVKAQAIIEYRENVMKFTTIEDLLAVKGIGHKILENNQTRLIVK